MSKSNLSINTLTGQAVDRMIASAARLRVAVSKGEAGETIIDAGQNARGGIEAGLAIAEICLGGLGTVAIAPIGANPKWPFELCVRSTDPVIACLASQYAGWALSHGEGKSAFFALGSGPGRALARKEPLFSELEYRDHATRATLILKFRAGAATRNRRKSRARLWRPARKCHLHFCAHAKSRGQRSGRRARAGSRAA